MVMTIYELLNIMKTLYIHGLDSSPKADKLKILQEFGLEVIAPFSDYRVEGLSAFNKLRELAVSNQVEFIIGSSLGGFIGYWLADELGIRSLLFNPALQLNSIELQLPHGGEPRSLVPKYIVLGANDTVVDPIASLQWLESQVDYTVNRVITCSWLSHKIDTSTFREMTAWTLAGLFSR
jgi:hypothetical protein